MIAIEKTMLSRYYLRWKTGWFCVTIFSICQQRKKDYNIFWNMLVRNFFGNKLVYESQHRLSVFRLTNNLLNSAKFQSTDCKKFTDQVIFCYVSYFSASFSLFFIIFMTYLVSCLRGDFKICCFFVKIKICNNHKEKNTSIII